MLLDRRVVVVERDAVRPDQIEVDTLDDGLVRPGQIVQAEVLELDGVGPALRRVEQGVAVGADRGRRVTPGPLAGPGLEGVGGVAVRLVGQELPDQPVAEVIALVARRGAVGVRVVLGRIGVGHGPGRDEPGLDLHQGRGHDKELAGAVDVDAVQVAQRRNELVRDPGDGQVDEIHLRPPGEVQQQVQGALELLEPDGVILDRGHGGGAPPGPPGVYPWSMPGRTVQPNPAPPRPEAEPDEAFARRAIRAEAEAVARVAALIDGRFVRAVDLMAATADAAGSIVVTGVGKSGLIGQKISATLASLGAPSQWVHPTEAAHGDLGRIRRGDTLLALSYSGQTDEVTALASILRQDGADVISITKGAGDSALERVSTVALAVGDVEEACPLSLAPTSSTTAMLALGDALALAVARRRSFTPDDFARRHPGGWLGDLLRPVLEVIRFRAGENLPVVSDSLSVRAALEAAAAAGRRPGALVLVDGRGALSGVFTDGDLRRLILDDPARLDAPIASVMTRSPRTLPASALVRDAVALIREARQDEIPVVDPAGAPVGLLDVQDLVAMRVIRE
ncbi:MAG: KpsF/GutQ family sugar-phosphate isomerase [Planctomycetota bacterium]|nr:MAG: KpsF/GutQ family sugar-phosphate isomerase [Planctomycetota bacterium]